MDDSTFAHQLMAWLDPLQVLRCGSRLQSDRDAALSEQVLIIGSGALSDGSEARFDQLVAKFLRGFEFPLEVLRLLASTQDNFPFSNEDLTWLANLELKAAIRVCSRSTPVEKSPVDTILLIRERDAVLDLLRDPILALLDIVTRCAWMWREWKERDARVYYEPSVPSPFFSYVERQVAESYVDLEPAPHLTGMAGPNLRYRAVTAFGVTSLSAAMFEVVRESARVQARGTWDHSTIEQKS
jgi:hypothetical protein